MGESRRAPAREITRSHFDAGDPLGWFEDLYLQAGEDTGIIPWADLAPNPNLVDWRDRCGATVSGRALKVGSGLGDDAEELARRGYQTTAFDISGTAIAKSRERFPNYGVRYVVADLFDAPNDWKGGFDFVLESYTLQVLPPGLRAEAIRCITSFVAPGGTLLVIARGREPDEPGGAMPWPVTREELTAFQSHGLKEISFFSFSRSDPALFMMVISICGLSFSSAMAYRRSSSASFTSAPVLLPFSGDHVVQDHSNYNGIRDI